MSTDRRWVLIEILPCPGSITVSGAGTEAVNGTYCPDGMENGWAVWTKVGGTRLEDSIYRAFYDSGSGLEDLGYFIMTSGGSFEDDPLNALYSTFGTPGDPNLTWDIYGSFGPGGAAPGPRSRFYADREPVIRNFGPLQYARFSEEEDLSVGLIKKRRKLTTDIVFTGADFDYFRSIEKDATRRCEELIIRRQMRCDGMWKTIWTGTFSTGSGEWDLDACEFKVRPDPLDEYTCIMRAMNKKVNILEVAPTDIAAVIWPSTIEILIYFGGYPSPPFPSLVERGFIEVDSQVVSIPALGGLCPDPDTPTAHIMWRERIDLPCVDGVANPPPGVGWFQDPLGPTCTDPGPVIWVRPTALVWPWPNDPLVVGPITVGGYDEPTSPACNSWIRVGAVNCIGTQNGVGIFICTDDAEDFETLTTGRNMQDVANLFVERSECEITAVVSDFFEWDPIGDAPGYVSGENYVTGAVNQVDHLFLLQKSDAIDPTATNPATKGEMTLKEFVELLRTSFQVFWAIDSNGNLRFEHWTFWTTPVGLAMIDYDIDVKSEPLSYAHLKAEIPQRERPKWSEAFGEDFVGVDIIYSGPCVSEEQTVKEYNVPRVTTDLVFVRTDPDEINKDGFVMLATIQDGSDYSVILDSGALSGSLNTNAPLSWANLERDFWTWNRFLFNANMNEADVVFDGIQPNIEQRNVFLKFCCDYTDFDSSERVATKLGFKLGGINAFIRRAEFDEATDGLTLTLRYAY